MKILIASANNHKVEEIKSILSEKNIDVVSHNDFPPIPDVAETGVTLEENAHIKALAYHKETGLPVIADDTGLFVDALNGKPGVYSARYAGDDATYSDNCNKLISELKKLGLKSSPAHFMTVICYLKNENDFKFFEGRVNGMIATELCGTNGFGYDPLFIPDGYDITFAEMTNTQKNELSHRARAVKKFVEGVREE